MSAQWLRPVRSLPLRQVLRYDVPIMQHCGVSRYYSTVSPPLPFSKPSSELTPFVYDYTRALLVSTLDAKRLDSSDYHVLPTTPVVGLSPKMPGLNTEDVSSDDYANSHDQPHQLPYASFLAYGPEQGTVGARFPPDQRGFFYYHSQSTSSPYSGQLRFRLTPSSDPGSWAVGSDLLKPNGLPWNNSLLAISTLHPKLTAIRNLLLADGLITPELVERCQQVFAWRRSLGRPNLLLTGLGQPFLAKFQALDAGQFAVVGRKEQEFIRINAFFRDSRNRQEDGPLRPYRGSAICQFEQYKSRRPSRSIVGKPPTADRVSPRKVVMRVLKIVDPVSCAIGNYDGYVNEPREGQLMAMGQGDARRAWSYDVDTGEEEHRSRGRNDLTQKNMLNGLKLLFDYEQPMVDESKR